MLDITLETDQDHDLMITTVEDNIPQSVQFILRDPHECPCDCTQCCTVHDNLPRW